MNNLLHIWNVTCNCVKDETKWDVCIEEKIETTPKDTDSSVCKITDEGERLQKVQRNTM